MWRPPCRWRAPIEECRLVVEAQKQSGKKYCMMETTVFTREYLFVKELVAQGELGRIQFIRAAHHQEMAAGNWPAYWPGMPPMHYATHCVGPVLGLTGKSTEWVSCLGSGRVDDKYARHYGSPFAVETTHMKLKDSDVHAEITRSLYNTAREYIESFDVYGSKASFEWQQIAAEEPVIHYGEDAKRVPVPDYAKLLPAEIQRFTTKGVYDLEGETHMSFIQGAGHGGSHPHLVNEFVSSIVEDRDPFPNAVQSANWTCTGICAHDSALRGGEIVRLPEWTLDLTIGRRTNQDRRTKDSPESSFAILIRRFVHSSIAISIADRPCHTPSASSPGELPSSVRPTSLSSTPPGWPRFRSARCAADAARAASARCAS